MGVSIPALLLMEFFPLYPICLCTCQGATVTVSSCESQVGGLPALHESELLFIIDSSGKGYLAYWATVRKKPDF